MIRIDQPPSSFARWQHESQICFETFQLSVKFHSILMGPFVSYEENKVLRLKPSLMFSKVALRSVQNSLGNIRLGWKGLPGTLTYFAYS